MTSGESPLVGMLLTSDERVCVSVCTTNPIPGSLNAPSPPKDARLGQSDYGPGSNVDEELDLEWSTESDDDSDLTSIPINCDDNGDNRV